MTVRIGFIGCGTHATRNLYPSLRFADCELVAAADPVEDRRNYVKSHFGAQHLYDDYSELLEKEQLDGLIVCGPPSLHMEAGLAGLRKGIPVLVEKPPAPSVEGAQELAKAAEENGAFAMVALMKRFAQKYVIAKNITEQPAFGRPRHILLRYSFHMSSKDPRHLLYMMGIHAVDLMRFFMGEVKSFTAEWDSENNVSVLLRFADESTGTLVLNATAPGVTERVEITGDGEAVIVDEVANLTHYPKQDMCWKPMVSHQEIPNFPLQVPENDTLFLQGYAGEIMAFVEAVKKGQSPQGVSIQAAIKNLELLEDIASIRSGGKKMES